jgi:hypothetical protein
MTYDPKVGDELWIRAKVRELRDGGQVNVTVFTDGINGLGMSGNVRKADVRKSPPSEQSETAELERAVVEAARPYVHRMREGGELGQLWHELKNAVDALEKALAPPSLEDEIKAELELLAKCSENNALSKAAVAVSLNHIIALVEAHES